MHHVKPLWFASFIAILLNTLFWAATVIISFTRLIPGWTIIDDDHSWFLGFTVAGAICAALIIILVPVYIFTSLSDLPDVNVSSRVMTLGYILVSVVSYLIGLAFSWAYDNGFVDGNTQPFFDCSTTLYWMNWNWGLFVAGGFMLFVSVQTISIYILNLPRHPAGDKK